jgi:hypothetical protein
MKKALTRKKLPILLRWVGWVLLVQFILFNISAALYAHKFTTISDDPALRQVQPARNIFAKTWRLFSGPRQARSLIRETPVFAYDTVLWQAGNGTTIEAWHGRTDSLNKGIVLLFHGVQSNKGMLLAEANDFRYQGFDVLLVDFRGHGNSGGKTITLGVKETEEVKLAHAFAKAKGYRNIFLWGSSMGAVVVAKAVSEYRLEPSGIILEMPFGSLQSHLKARARVLGFPEQPFGFLVTCWIGIERGFNGWRHNTARYARHITCPVLVQSGEKDDYVRQKEINSIYAALATAEKKSVVYGQAAHESLLGNEPVKWRHETGSFLKKYSR